MLRRGFCFQPLRSLCHAETKESFEIPGGEGAEFFVLKPKSPCRSFPWKQFVGGEESEYFAPDRSFAVTNGVRIVPWRRPGKGVASRVRI